MLQLGLVVQWALASWRQTLAPCRALLFFEFKTVLRVLLADDLPSQAMCVELAPGALFPVWVSSASKRARVCPPCFA